MMGKKAVYTVLTLLLVLGLTGCETKPEDIVKWKSQGNSAKLIEALNHSDSSIQLSAMQALAELKTNEAVAPISRFYQSENLNLKYGAIEATIAIGSDDAALQLLEILKLESPKSRTMAITGLGLLKPDFAIEPLSTALNDSQETVATAAAESLGRLGNPKAIAVLQSKLKDRSYNIRYACVVSLGQIGGEATIDALAIAADDHSENVRKAAINNLIKIGKPAVDYAISALRSDHSSTRENAVVLLDATDSTPTSGNDLVWLQLIAITSDKQSKASLTEKVLILTSINGATPGLIEAAAHPAADIRRYAVLALESIGEPCVAEVVSTAKQQASTEAGNWLNKRSSWPGAPSWRLDLWAATTALNPGFNPHSGQARMLQKSHGAALKTMTQQTFKTSNEIMPMMIKLLSTSTAVDEKGKRLYAVTKKRLLASPEEALMALLAALSDKDISVASGAAEILTMIGGADLDPILIEAFAGQVAKGIEASPSGRMIELYESEETPLTGSPYHNIIIQLDSPDTEALLIKVPPNAARALQVVKKKYSDIKGLSNLPLQFKSDATKQAIPFKLRYEKDGQRKELKVVFRPNEAGDWVPTPPLPDSLP